MLYSVMLCYVLVMFMFYCVMFCHVCALLCLCIDIFMFCYVYILLCLCFICSFIFKGWQTVISQFSERGGERNKEYAICKHSRKVHGLIKFMFCYVMFYYVSVMLC